MNQINIITLPQTQDIQTKEEVTKLNEKEQIINETEKSFKPFYHDSQTQLIKYKEVYTSQDNVEKQSKQLFISSPVCVDQNKGECVSSQSKTNFHKKLFLIVKNTPTLISPNNTSSTCSSANDNCNNHKNDSKNKRNENRKKLKKKESNSDLNNKSTNIFEVQLFNVNNYDSIKHNHKIDDNCEINVNERNNNYTSFHNRNYKNYCDINSTKTNNDINSINYINSNQIFYQNGKINTNFQPPCELHSSSISHLNKSIINTPITPTFKETYLDLLITSADSLIKNGLNISTLLKSDSPVNIKSNEPHKCGNKLCPVIFSKHNTSYKVKMNSLHKQNLHLCINCYQAFQKEQYCYYCGIIYREYKGKKGFNDSKTWIGCEYCSHWEHLQCEEEEGLFKNLRSLIQDNEFKYMCPICREKERKKKKGKERLIKFINYKRKRYLGKEKNEGRNVKKKKICRCELYSDVEKILLLEGNKDLY